MITFKTQVELNAQDKISPILDKIGNKLGAMSQKFNETKRNAAGLFLSNELFKAGEGILGALTAGVQSAAKFETAMANVKIVTRSTAAEMKELSKTVVEVSQRHAMSSLTAAKMVGILGSSGVSKKELTPQFVESIASYGDAMKYSKNAVGFEESTKLGVQIAHLFGKYDSKGITPLLDSFYKASNISVGSPTDMLNIVKQFAPLAGLRGVSNESIIEASAMMENLGLGSRGGNGLKNIIMRTLPGGGGTVTGHAQNQRLEGLRHLGIFGKNDKLMAADAAGNFDLNKFAEIIHRDLVNAKTAKERDTVGANAVMAFGARGAGEALLLGKDTNFAKLNEFKEQWASMTGVVAANTETDKLFEKQLGILETDFETLRIKAVQPLLPMLTELVVDMTKVADKVGPWIERNGKLVTGLVIATGALSTLAITLGTIGKAVFGFKLIMDAFGVATASASIKTAASSAASSAAGAIGTGATLAGTTALGAAVSSVGAVIGGYGLGRLAGTGIKWGGKDLDTHIQDAMLAVSEKFAKSPKAQNTNSTSTSSNDTHITIHSLTIKSNSPTDLAKQLAASAGRNPGQSSGGSSSQYVAGTGGSSR